MSSPSPQEHEQAGSSRQRDLGAEAWRCVFESWRDTAGRVAFSKLGRGGWATGPRRVKGFGLHPLCVESRGRDFM